MKLKIAAALAIGMICLLAVPADLALIDNEVYYFGEDGYMKSNGTALNGLFNITEQGNFVPANPETVQGRLAYHGIRAIAVMHRMLTLSQWYTERTDKVRLVIPELEKLKAAAQGIVSICDSDPSGVYAACRQPAATVLENIATVRSPLRITTGAIRSSRVVPHPIGTMPARVSDSNVERNPCMP